MKIILLILCLSNLKLKNYLKCFPLDEQTITVVTTDNYLLSCNEIFYSTSEVKRKEKNIINNKKNTNHASDAGNTTEKSSEK